MRRHTPGPEGSVGTTTSSRSASEGRHPFARGSHVVGHRSVERPEDFDRLFGIAAIASCRRSRSSPPESGSSTTAPMTLPRRPPRHRTRPRNPRDSSRGTSIRRVHHVDQALDLERARAYDRVLGILSHCWTALPGGKVASAFRADAPASPARARARGQRAAFSSSNAPFVSRSGSIATPTRVSTASAARIRWPRHLTDTDLPMRRGGWHARPERQLIGKKTSQSLAVRPIRRSEEVVRLHDLRRCTIRRRITEQA